MAHDEVVLLLPEGASALLDENGVDLVDELRRLGLDVERSHGADPAMDPDAQSREIVTVLVASAALVAVISAGVCKILDALGRNRSFVAEEVELAPVVDPGGEVVVGRDGEPILYWRNKTTLVEAQPRSVNESTDISGPAGIRITQTSTSSGSPTRTDG